MAVTNQQIFDYLLANPGLSDAQIAATMQEFNVTPAQMAAAVGLPVEEVQTRYNEAAPSVYTPENVNKLADQILSQGTTETWTGGLPPEKAALYMADELAKSGVTDITQVAKGDDGIINSMTGEKLMSGYGERTKDNLWSGSYEGKGNTGFGVNFDESGKPVFYTQGASSSDTKDIARIIQAGLLLSGAGGALGGALNLTGAAAQAVGTGLISTGTAAIGGANFEDALKTGLLSGGLAYGGSALNNYLSTGTTADPGITERQFAIADAKQLADQGLSTAQIKDTLTAGGYNDIIVDRAVASVTTPPAVTTTTATTSPTGAVSTPVIDNAAVNITGTAAPSIDTSGLLGGLVNTTPVAVSPPVTDNGTVKVTGTSTPQQVNQAVVDLINSQLGTNVGTPTNLANVEVKGDRPSTTTEDAVSNVAATLPINQPAPNAVDPRVTITGDRLTNVGDTLATLPASMLPPSVTNNTTTTTPAKKTNELGLTDEQIINILKASLGLFGTSSLINKGTPTPVIGALPTQTPPMYTDDYFTRIQQNYNSLLPAVPRDVASPLRDWYTSQYGA